VVNVWAVDHQGHVPRMAAIMQSFGLDPARLTILMYDLVKLVRDGQEVKLSKRAGNLLTIGDVVDEVGADAMRFNLLTRSPESTIEFDLDLAVAQSNENPVYYVQYSHARICSILDRAAHESYIAQTPADLSLLQHPAELALLRRMLELEEQIELAVDKLSPHNLTHYAIELARTFNAFYRDCKVLDAEQPALSHARLLLAQACRIVLAKVLTLLGVRAPETM
jgi:arginyl-tRNA synthetase